GGWAPVLSPLGIHQWRLGRPGLIPGVVLFGVPGLVLGRDGLLQQGRPECAGLDADQWSARIAERPGKTVVKAVGDGVARGTGDRTVRSGPAGIVQADLVLPVPHLGDRVPDRLGPVAGDGTEERHDPSEIGSASCRERRWVAGD